MWRRWRESGTQTLEVMIALSLLSITLLGMTGLLVGTISAGALAETSSVASNLARQRIEALRSTAPINFGTYTDSVVVPPFARPFTIVTQVNAPSVGRAADVTVIVTWQVAFGSACAGSRCAGNVRTYTRTMQTKICVVGSPVGGAPC